jgi:hypothetical protein
MARSKHWNGCTRIKSGEDFGSSQKRGTPALEVCYWCGRWGWGRLKLQGDYFEEFALAIPALFALANWILELCKVVCLLMSALGA